MTREEEAIAILENEKKCVNRANKNDYCNRDCYNCELVKTDTEILNALDMAIKALEQEPCEDAISREDALMALTGGWTELTDEVIHRFIKRIKALSPVKPQPKTGHCKDCKWWKDSDGVYRRGVRADSQCPINRKEVYEGNGYCYMFEQQEREE